MSSLASLFDLPHLPRCDLLPLTTIDSIPLPGSLIFLQTPDDYDSLLSRLQQVLAVVNIWEIHEGVEVVGLTAEVAHGLAGYRSQIRHDRRKGTTLYEVTEKEPSLFVKIVQTQRPVLTSLPSQYQLDLSHRISEYTANLASACCLRQASVRGDSGFPDLIDSAITTLNQWILEGLAKIVLITRVSTGIHLVTSDTKTEAVFFIHDTILHRGPWLIAHHTILYPLQHLESHIDHIGGPTPTIRSTLYPKPTTKMKNTHEPIRRDGRLSYTWRLQLGLSIRQSLEEAREKSRRPLTRITTVQRTKPPIRDLHIFARTTQHSDKAHSRTLARQILSVVLDPPPDVERDFSNVQRLCIDYEISESWFLPGRDRKVFTQLQQQYYWREVEGGGEKDVYACVNPGLLSRRVVDMIGFDVPFTFQGIVGGKEEKKPNGDSEGDEDNKALDNLEDSDDDTPDLSLGGLTKWRTPSHEVLSQHVRDLEFLTSQGRIYGETDAYMSRLLRTNTNFALFHPSMRNLLAQLHFDRCVVFSRVSQKVRNDNSAHTPALSTQSDFGSRFCPPEVPTDRLECDSISASGDGAQIARRLSEITDALIVVSSVERICRTHEGLRRIRELCQTNNLAILILIWPPTSILGLSLASQDTSFLTADVLERIYNLQILSRQTRSLPSLFPTLIACKSSPTSLIHPLVTTTLHNRVASSEAYLRGFSASRYQGSTHIDLPPTLARDRWKAGCFPKHMEQAIRICLPNIEIAFGCFEMTYNTECHCSLWNSDVGEGCQDECRCTCEVCLRNQRFICGLTPRELWSPCTCSGHHEDG